MARYAMIIDQERCVGCQSCTVACKSEWNVPEGYARTHVRQTGIQGTYPKLTTTFHVSQCNNCEKPTCVPACPTGATYQAEDGTVRVNRHLCIGCGSCAAACPYGARYVNPTLGKVDKCDFCSPRLEKGQLPACVETCPGKAKIFGNLEDRSSHVYQLVYREGARRSETSRLSIGPNVFYTGKKDKVDLELASFVPGEPRMIPASAVWTSLVKKLVYVAVGATFLGQAVAFFSQLATGEKQFEEHP